MTTPPAIPRIKRALLSVSNKEGLVDFARQLIAMGVEIISTGGTSQCLAEANLPHLKVEDVTGLPEMLGGRVKTLHPKIHGGILGKRDLHADDSHKHEIPWIDLVIVNFYPFVEAIQKKDIQLEEAVEYIDIGGPTMVRAAAKNFAWVGIVIDVEDYPRVIEEISDSGGLSLETRQQLAQKAFALTSAYDAAIQDYFQKLKPQYRHVPHHLTLSLQKHVELRYGENPHQRAYAYQSLDQKSGVLSAHQYQGKPLSFNNILDAEAAWSCVSEFSESTCVIVKHANPCGVACGETILEAYKHALAADSLSAFGGIVALNRVCNAETATAILDVFTEVILAPAYSAEALALFANKPNVRVLEMPNHLVPGWEMKFITGGLLMQEKDQQKITAQDLKVVTKIQPQEHELNAMLFAWRVLKHIKSNGILIAKNNVTLGVGAGQVARIDAVEIALRKASGSSKNAILASDAFFPFRDSIDRIAASGIRAIIQPGGSVKDEEVITACNEHGIAMAMTGLRCFKH